MIEIDDNNNVLRDGKTIGTIQGDTCVLTCAIGPAIKGQIKKAAGRDLAFAIVEGTTFVPPPEPKREIPPPPDRHPQLGDKDPAYREWFKAHHSAEEYERKYSGRVFPATMSEWQKKQDHIVNPLRKLANEVEDSQA